MFCTNCGNQVPDGAKFCTACGAPIGQRAPQQPQQAAAPVYQQAPVRAAAPAPQQPRQTYQAAPAAQAVPMYAAAQQAKKLVTTKWPVSTGIMGILHMVFYLAAQIPMAVYYASEGISGAMFSWTRIVYILLAIGVPVLFFVHTKKIAILTAIPMFVILILDAISTFSSLRYGGSYGVLSNLLTFVPSFVLVVLYVIQMLVRPHSAAMPIIYLIFAIIAIILTFIANIRIFTNYSYYDSYMTYLAITLFGIWVADIFAYVAYIIAMFSSRKR
ncbi:MAG: zinc ribbon domain-containing protein [Lachnospiraceae bacterium]|nr:zinc ribbon domain-containing protein [Lachnospiraceae bacterium]